MNDRPQMNLIKDDIFQRLYDDVSTNYKGEIVLSHFGVFTQDFVTSLTEGIERIMRNNGAKKVVIKRMFSIMIEGLQNIRLHGSQDEKRKQLGHVMIMDKGGEYFISFGNLIKNKEIEHLSKYIKSLNALDKSGIKQKYLKTLERGMMSDKGGAGLGFITIRMKSKSPVVYQFLDYSDQLSYLEMGLSLE